MKDGPRWKTTDYVKIEAKKSVEHELTQEERERLEKIKKQREDEF